jgi:hypothetical protein
MYNAPLAVTDAELPLKVTPVIVATTAPVK